MNIRRAWLVMLWISVISCIVIFVVTTLFLAEPPTYASKLVLSKLKALNESSSFIEYLIVFPIFYFCSYKQPGTKLLFCSILWSYICIAILSIATFGALLIYFDVRNMELIERAWNLRAISFALGALAFMTLWRIGWLYCCVQLRKYNLKFAPQEVWLNPTYRERLDQFQAINDMEKLEVFYSSTVRDFPEIEKYLTAAFRRQKSHLNESEDILEI